MSRKPRSVQQEIKQRKPFATRPQEVVVAIFRTFDVMSRHIARTVEQAGLTRQQYNVLRILRGAYPKPLSRQQITDRMIEEQPGVTRLLDRLEQKRLIRRERSTDDRRVVRCWITPRGLQLLEQLDQPILDADAELVAPLRDEEQQQLLEFLSRIRSVPD